MDSVLTIPKIYLDSCHLINIAKVRKGDTSVPQNRRAAYARIDDFIRTHHFGLIFNPAAPIEWVDGNATLESAFEIANVVDSAALQYELEMDTFVYLREILNELHRLDPALSLPEYEILHVRDRNQTARRALAVLVNNVPSFFDEGELLDNANELPPDVPFGTAREAVERAWKFKQDRPHVVQERVDGHKDAFGRDLAAFGNRNRKPIQQRDVIKWMKRFLRVDRILNALNMAVDVDSLLTDVEIPRCPAVNLFLNAHEKRLRAADPPHDNDVDDWLYVPVFPHADLILTERNLRGFINQADSALANKATHDPNRALEILTKWIEPVAR